MSAPQFGRLATFPDWRLATLRRDPAAGTPECEALVACVALPPEFSGHDLDCAVVHDRMLSRRLRLDAEGAR